MALFDALDVAYVGIGGQEPSGLLASSGNVFSPEELEGVRDGGGIGDIGQRYLRADGTPVDTPLHERVIGIELAQLRRVPRSVAVAGGPGKTEAIRAAVVGGWINCLITDSFTAERLMRTSEPATAAVEAGRA
jgi:DNA-binding transcriptional regulator LsrR (DeoR family)